MTLGLIIGDFGTFLIVLLKQQPRVRPVIRYTVQTDILHSAIYFYIFGNGK